jgi:hypothetical protein
MSRVSHPAIARLIEKSEDAPRLSGLHRFLCAARRSERVRATP